jgi:N utilization substance protein B
MLSVKPKTIARIASVQSLYYYHATDLDINQVIENIKVFYEQEKLNNDSQFLGLKLNKDYFYELTHAAIQNNHNIDALIEKNLTQEWNITKQHLIMLSILRVGITELCYFLNTPFKVVINEFSDIAGNMLMSNEVNFVNSLLQKISDDNQKVLIKTYDPFA